ncbi:hypothetical protein C0J52_00128, partial [Blattella germanica]
ILTLREPKPPSCIFSSISKIYSRSDCSKIISIGVPGGKLQFASSCFCERADFLGSGIAMSYT